jgi:hypothetical protein
MKKYLIFLSIALCFSINLRAQKNDQKPNSPKEDIKVSREYDEHGNLIKFDSVYSYNWSGDSTLMKSFSPENFPDLFGNHFGNFPDSAFFGDSFFGGFDPFMGIVGGTPDSTLMKKFGLNHHFQNFEFKNDSLAMNQNDFDNFFRNFGESPKDSSSEKLFRKKFGGTQNGSMDELLKMMEQQMRQMEEYQRKFFKEQPKLKEF